MDDGSFFTRSETNVSAADTPPSLTFKIVFTKKLYLKTNEMEGMVVEVYEQILAMAELFPPFTQ